MNGDFVWPEGIAKAVTHMLPACRGIVQPNKMISYLVDLQTVRVLDLLNGATAASISHDARVDWLVRFDLPGPQSAFPA